MAAAQTHTLLEAALAYAAKGWHVIPLHDVTTGVAPAVPTTVSRASTRALVSGPPQPAPTRHRSGPGGSSGPMPTSASRRASARSS